MTTQVFRSNAARLWRCRCLISRRAKAYYSQSALSAVTSSGSNGGTRAGTWSDSCNESSTIRNPLDPTRLDRYLSSVRTADLEPTLDDVGRYKPQSFSRPDSPQYAAEYTNLLESLCRSFSKDQLRRFAELYKLDPIWTRVRRRKTEYAESIIEKAWGWPSLKEIERKQRDTTEVLVKSFTVSPAQLFLMMGKDGADLLQLSMQYNVHISLTASPLALRVEGLRGSLKGLSEYISSLKKSIIDEIFELPTGRPVQPDMLQRISRLAGAYVENHGNRGKVRICAKDPSDIAAAKRLVLRPSLEAGARPSTVCYDAPGKARDSPIKLSELPRYSVFPFVIPGSFPWTMHTGGTFRLRRVAEWLGVDSYENIDATGGLVDNPHRLLDLNQSRAQLTRLVCPTFPDDSYRQRSITATLGHILMSSGDSSTGTIFPPLRGNVPLLDVLKWVKISGKPLTFVPSAPPVMTTIKISKRRHLHRLIYRTLPQIFDQGSKLTQHVLKFEMILSGRSSESTQAKEDFENAPKLEKTSSPDESIQDAQMNLSHPESLPEMLNGWDTSYQVGRQTYVNLMLPDRPMDVQFCTYDWNDVTLNEQPQVLREYVDKLRDFSADIHQLDPPSTFNCDGRAYYLHDHLNLKQSNSPISVSTSSNDGHTDNLGRCL
ncbi:hypothetical protein JVU11DRAFT_5248 [Chiua virens]|nr:hypothetical protein JVU11DRAFT_5248 [Chiua virens]